MFAKVLFLRIISFREAPGHSATTYKMSQEVIKFSQGSVEQGRSELLLDEVPCRTWGVSVLG